MTTRSRYVDAATVSDEHGKGAEVLRQQVNTISNNVSRTLMVTEVDVVIRTVKVSPAAAFTAGAVRLYQVASGSSSSTSITESFDLSSLSAYEIGELTLEVSEIDKDSTIYATTTSTNPSSSHVTVHLGWMPNMFSLDSDHRTYALPV